MAIKATLLVIVVHLTLKSAVFEIVFLQSRRLSDKQRGTRDINQTGRICINKMKILIRTCIHWVMNWVDSLVRHAQARCLCTPQYDQGRQWRVGKRTNCSTNVSLGKRVSEVSRQSEDICSSISFSFPIPLYCLIFGPSEHSAVAFLTLISRSSLLTRLSHSVCVFVMQGGGISPQYCEVHTRTNHLISKHTQMLWNGNQTAEQ